MNRVLIVDDEPANVKLLRRILEREGGFEVVTTLDPREVLPLCDLQVVELVLLDVNMPHIDGLTLLSPLFERFPSRAEFPVIVLTADANPETKHRALRLGANDFLTKPFDAIEVVLRVKQHLERRRMHAEMVAYESHLEERVRERTRELEEAHIEIVDRLSRATEMRDDDTGEHVERVAALTGAIARAMGVPEDEARLTEQAVRLHDVGKIAVPDRILLKRGPLEEEERNTMREHAAQGARILGGSRSSLLQRAEEIAMRHHERWDGTGYPDGRAGEAIPLAARIAAVADVFDALTNERPYKRAWADAEAIEEIRRCSGSQFDPRVVEAFLLCRTEDEGAREGETMPQSPLRQAA